MILHSESSLSFFCCSITIANCCCNFSTSVLRKLSALSLSLLLHLVPVLPIYSALPQFFAFFPPLSIFLHTFVAFVANVILTLYQRIPFLPVLSHVVVALLLAYVALLFLPFLLPLSLQVSVFPLEVFVFPLSPLVHASLHASVSLRLVSVFPLPLLDPSFHASVSLHPVSVFLPLALLLLTSLQP